MSDELKQFKRWKETGEVEDEDSSLKQVLLERDARIKALEAQIPLKNKSDLFPSSSRE